MIRRGNLSARDRIAASILAIVCVVLGAFGFVLGVVRQTSSVSLAAVFVVALGIVYARAAILGRSMEWPWR